MAEKFDRQFAEAYARYSQPIYRYCYFRVYSSQLAEELMQETFMRVWKYLREGKSVASMQALLYQIARNLVIDLSRRNKVKKRLEDTVQFSVEATGEPSYDGKLEMEERALLDEVYQMMRSLSHEAQDMLIMRFIEGLSPREIAEIFHTTPNNISVRIYKSLKKLGRYL